MSGQGGRLSDTETQRLLNAAQRGDLAARERLVAANLPLVHSIAQRFCATGRDGEDLFQVGCIGLLKAISRFDLTLGYCFSTYAVPLIMGEIRRHLRDDSTLRISRQLRERASRLQRCRRELYQAVGAEPELAVVAQACGLDLEQALTALEAAQPTRSFSEPLYLPSGDAMELGDTLRVEPEPIGEALCDRLTLLKAMESLPERLSYILRCRYFGDRTQSELAAELGVSQVQISRLEKKALGLVKAKIEGK